MKKRRVLLSALACLLLLPLVICGCSSENSGPVEIDSINASVRVVRIGSGLEILVVTRDNQGFPVETDGSLDIKLWLQEEKGGDVIYDYLVDEWNGVQISSDNYSSHKGASVELVYNEEFSFTDAYGSLDVTLLTPDDKTFTDSIYDVMISEAYAC